MEPFDLDHFPSRQLKLIRSLLAPPNPFNQMNRAVRGLTNYALIGFAVFGASYTASKVGIPKPVIWTAAGAAAVALFNSKHYEKALFGDVLEAAPPSPPAQEAEAKPRDLSYFELNAIKAEFGGDEGFSNLIAFTQEHAPDGVIDAYNEVVEAGEPEQIIEFLQGLDAARTRILTSAATTPDSVGELIARNNEGEIG